MGAKLISVRLHFKLTLKTVEQQWKALALLAAGLVSKIRDGQDTFSWPLRWLLLGLTRISTPLRFGRAFSKSIKAMIYSPDGKMFTPCECTLMLADVRHGGSADLPEQGWFPGLQKYGTLLYSFYLLTSSNYHKHGFCMMYVTFRSSFLCPVSFKSVVITSVFQTKWCSI